MVGIDAGAIPDKIWKTGEPDSMMSHDLAGKHRRDKRNGL